MKNKIIRILGKRGRITIPFELCAQMNIGCDDILSFAANGKDEIVIRKEMLCDGCAGAQRTENIAVSELLDGLTREQQYSALVHLSANLAQYMEVKEA